MKFSVNARHWWTRSTATEQWSLDDRWLPLLGLGGVLTALLFSVWCCGPSALTAEEIVKDATVATAAAMPGDFHQLPAVHIRLRADAAGTLASIALNGQAVKDIDDLRGQIRAFLGPTAANATVEAELDCDAHLCYEQVQQIVAAISAYAATDGRSMVPLVDRIRFSPPRKAAR